MENENFFYRNDTIAEIDITALKNNYIRILKHLKAQNKNYKICSVVKANAYGHGMLEISDALISSGTHYLGTANYNESIKIAEHIKNKKKTKILCLGLLTDKKKYFKEILKYNIEVTAAEINTLKNLSAFAASENKKINVHIKVDTGMNRIGASIKNCYEIVNQSAKLKGISVKGIFSHLATSEKAGDSFAKNQIKKFVDLIAAVESDLMKIELKHIQNSGGIMNFSHPALNMARPGIMLYGYYPDKSLLKKDIGITPVMTVKSQVNYLKKINRGETVSYGRRYKAVKPTVIASIPIGYGDGYPRGLSGKGTLLINNQKFKVAGTVCMDWIMADVGRSKVKINDEVILLGKQIPAYDLAEKMNTIPYEITCNISPRVQRIYIKK